MCMFVSIHIQYIYVNKNESPNVLQGGKLENRQSIRF